MRFSTWIWLALAVAGGVALALWLGRTTEAATPTAIFTTAERGEFQMKVAATGELEAKRSEKIRGPQGMRAAQIYQTNITDLIPEGTRVEAGDYVARLDKTELDTKMKEAQNEIDRINTQLEAAKIDTAIALRALRDELINLKFGMREKQLEVEQSKYEAPMVIQQAEIALERSERDYQQLLTKYRLTQEKSVATINEILAGLRQFQLRMNTLQGIAGEFVITAPKAGMVIYARSWNGKIGPGSQISSWDPVVAELPDLSDMVSKTYVNEVDISRVRKGQRVNMEVDAFPDRAYTGQVIRVANIGEQLRNYDSKVFEVLVQVFEKDSILRPAMTTSNEIVTDVLPDKVFIPLEALFTDSLTYVFRRVEGRAVKQEVMSSWTNDNEVVISHGLSGGEQLFLNVPPDAESLEFIPLDPAIKAEIEAELAAERAQREALSQQLMRSVPDEDIPRETGGGGGFVIFN